MIDLIGISLRTIGIGAQAEKAKAAKALAEGFPAGETTLGEMAPVIEEADDDEDDDDGELI